ncbi:MAG: hypothetical protein WCA83_03770 [Azonexus sp.]
MHPSTAMLITVIAIVAIQFVGLAGLVAVFGLQLLAGRHSIAGWWRLVRRMRWLLLSVWLILAYGVPGDALFEVSWMPTHEGIREATLHVVRLILMLGCLAWLFSSLGKQGLLVALHGLLHPLARFGIASERLVVRLSLVMQNLQNELPKGAWRNMLDGNAVHGAGPETLQVTMLPWRLVDYFVFLAVLAFSCLLIALGMNG